MGPGHIGRTVWGCKSVWIVKRISSKARKVVSPPLGQTDRGTRKMSYAQFQWIFMLKLATSSQCTMPNEWIQSGEAHGVQAVPKNATDLEQEPKLRISVYISLSFLPNKDWNNRPWEYPNVHYIMHELVAFIFAAQIQRIIWQHKLVLGACKNLWILMI